MGIQKEIIWAVSGTGEDFQCVDASFALEQQAEIERLTAENERLRAALADAATCSNDECHGAHVALEALRSYQQSESNAK